MLELFVKLTSAIGIRSLAKVGLFSKENGTDAVPPSETKAKPEMPDLC